MQRKIFVVVLVVTSVICSGPASAQDENSTGPKTAGATAVESPPTLDGDVLNDPAWAGVMPTSGFIQKTPDEGKPAWLRNRQHGIPAFSPSTY